MTKLHLLTDTSRPRKRTKLLGRGIGSRGVTCGRGTKGAGARSGYKRRYGYEGGRLPLFKKLPTRGFSNYRFQKRLDAINLDQIEAIFSDGEVVNVQTLTQKGYLSGPSHGIKVLGNGSLTKKVTLEVEALSSGARAKLQAAKITFSVKGEKEEA